MSLNARVASVTLPVHDLNRSFEFFASGLGLGAHFDNEGHCVHIELGEMKIILRAPRILASSFTLEPLKKDGLGVTLVVATPEQVDRLIQRAAESGAPYSSPPPAEGSIGSLRRGHFSDLDGFIWEVVFYPLRLRKRKRSSRAF